MRVTQRDSLERVIWCIERLAWVTWDNVRVNWCGSGLTCELLNESRLRESFGVLREWFESLEIIWDSIYVRVTQRESLERVICLCIWSVIESQSPISISLSSFVYEHRSLWCESKIHPLLFARMYIRMQHLECHFFILKSQLPNLVL